MRRRDELLPADREAIAHIRDLYGCPSDSAAMKLAVGMVGSGRDTLCEAVQRGFYPHI